MPKVFKHNKFALLAANAVAVAIWFVITNFIFGLIFKEDYPFYIYKIVDLIKFLPPIYLTYYLWVLRKS
tara:strand:+ start:174 stop:380 length:207 start_codon:yes stop_codon:yes gene_type:complete